MDKEKVMERLRKHAESMHSDWRERAEWRRNNRDWIRRSQEIALRMLNSMDEQHLTQRALAERMGCTQQYISKVLKGQENLSLETLVKIEDALGIELLVRTRKSIEYKVEETEPVMVAEAMAEYNHVQCHIGSINPLAYVAEDDTAMRIEDAEIAREMMEVLFVGVK